MSQKEKAMVGKIVFYRRNIPLVVLCSILSTNAFAAKIGSQEVTITATDTFTSRYIWRGQDLSPQDDPVMQPSIDVTLPKLIKETDVSINVWGSFPIGSGHEISTELDYSLTASRDFFDSFNVSSGYVYFDFTKANKNSDYNEFWGSLTWLELPNLPVPISATLFAGYEIEAAAEGPENGWYYSWGFGSELDLPQGKLFQEGQKLVLEVTNWGNDGVAGLKPSGLYATELSASTGYSFNGFSINPAFHYSFSHEENINSGDDEVWGSLDISYVF